MTSIVDIWSYHAGSGYGDDGASCAGYAVEALDGSIGKVDEATGEVGGGYIVVDTGPWIFGKKVMLPAGTVERIDHDREKVFVARTKDQVRHAPELEESRGADDTYRRDLGGYYGPGGRGWYDREGGYDPGAGMPRDWGSTPDQRGAGDVPRQ